MRVRKGIGVCTANGSTRPTPNITAIPKARENGRQKCTWMAATLARHLNVSPQTVSLWVTDAAEALPDAPVPAEVKEAEMDEIFTFIGDKKRESTF